MKTFKSSMALFTLLASLGTSLFSAHAQEADDDLKMPYDAQKDGGRDFIDIEGKIKPAPGKSAPAPQRQQQDNQDDFENRSRQDDRGDSRETSIAGRPQRRGNECKGLNAGEYAHAYGLYTRIFKQNSDVFVVYPVFTLIGRSDRQDDRRDDRQDDRYAHAQEQQRMQQQQQFQQQQMQRRGRLQQNAVDPGDELVPDVRQVYFEFRQVLRMDAWGRQYFEIIRDPHNEQVVVGMIPRRMLNAQQQQQQDYPVPNQRREQPNRSSQQETCVALPYMRVVKIEGATDVRGALDFVKSTPSETKRQASKASKELTPESLGPIADSDPGKNSK